MSLNDRDWYRDEHRKINGLGPRKSFLPHENNTGGSGQHVNDWLADQKTQKTKVIAKANSRTIPTDRVKSRRAAQPTQSNKAQGASVKRTDKGPPFDVMFLVLLCFLVALLTFFGALSLMVIKPEALQLSYEFVQKALAYIGAL